METNRAAAAILCSHVASGERPILLAARTSPEMEMDSGWQFLCNAETEDWSCAQVWKLSEVLRKEPTLEKYIDTPVGIALVRDNQEDEWRKR
jgi:hypothetical protein